MRVPYDTHTFNVLLMYLEIKDIVKYLTNRIYYFSEMFFKGK